jgi:hypothetical protein
MAHAGPGAAVRTVMVPGARPLSGHVTPGPASSAPLRHHGRQYGYKASTPVTGRVSPRVGTARRSYSQYRELTRSELATPYSAPQTASASAGSRELTTVDSRYRIRSGDASLKAWPSRPAGSTMCGAVIAIDAFREFRETFARKITRWPRSMPTGCPTIRPLALHHYQGRHSSPSSGAGAAPEDVLGLLRVAMSSLIEVWTCSGSGLPSSGQVRTGAAGALNMTAEMPQIALRRSVSRRRRQPVRRAPVAGGLHRVERVAGRFVNQRWSTADLPRP